MAEIATCLPYSQQIDGNRGFVADGDYFCRLVWTPFSLAATTIAAGSTIPLVKLPGGKVRIFPELSYIAFNDTFAATSDGHLGHQAYVNTDGTTVAADDNEWIDNADIGAAAVAGVWTATPFGTAANGSTAQANAEYDAQDGLVIEVLVDTAASDGATSTISGWVVWAPVP